MAKSVPNRPKVMVVGASGSLGGRVARRLLSSGVAVRAASREPESKLADLRGMGAETIRLDLREKESIEQAVQGVDRVLAGAHAFSPPRRDNTIHEVDGRGNRALIDAAARAGVDHLVLMSMTIAGPEAPTTYGRVKHAAEQYLRESDLSGTAVRADAFIESHVLDMMGNPLLDTGKVTMFGAGETPLRFVAVDDVAQIVCGLLLDDSPSRTRIIEMVGPEPMTRLEALRLLERSLGREARVRRLPVAGLRLMRAASRVFNPPLGYLVEASLAESTSPGYADSDAADERIVGTTRAEDVVAAWARDRLAESTSG